MEFVTLIMELDSLIEGDFSHPLLAEPGFRRSLYATTRAMSKAWRIPRPEDLMKAHNPATVLSILIESRRALETIFARRRTFVSGVSRELRISTAVCSLLTEQRTQIDRLIVEELGLSHPLLESIVVEAGGHTKEQLETAMCDF